MTQSKVQLSKKKIRLSKIPMPAYPGTKKDYNKHLADLQLEMLRVQQAYFREGRRAVMVFEGWDAGGKGGSIRRLTEKLDPRGLHVFPIGAPTPVELKQHYLQRFMERLPPKGRITIFDRSWYGRVLVERIEAFAKPAEWQRAFSEINEFERWLIDDDVRVLKFFLHITPDEQLNRFSERLRNPYKRWKLTADDIRNRSRWAQYESAIEEMFDKTSTVAAPWNIISGDHKWTARIQVLEAAVKSLSQDIDLTVPAVHPEVLLAAQEQLGIEVVRLPKARKRRPPSQDKASPKKDSKGKGGKGKGKSGKGKRTKK